MCIKEMNENEPLLKCRESLSAVKTKFSEELVDKYSGYLFIGYAAAVMKKA